MNKYEKAFNHLREHASFDTVDEMIDIKELVEKQYQQSQCQSMKKYKAKSMNFMVMSFGFAPNVKTCNGKR